MRNELDDVKLNNDLSYLKTNNPVVKSLGDRILDLYNLSSCINHGRGSENSTDVETSNHPMKAETSIVNKTIDKNEAYGKLSLVRDIIDVAQSRIHRHKLPEKVLDSLSFLRPLERKIVRIFNLIFKDQREVNHNMVNALKEILNINQSIFDVLVQQENCVNKLENKIISEIKRLDGDNASINSSISQYVGNSPDICIASLLDRVSSLENQLRQAFEEQLDAVVEEKLLHINHTVSNLNALVDSIKSTVENEASRVISLEVNQQAISTKVDSIQESYQDAGAAPAVSPDQAKIEQGFWFNDPIVTGYQPNGKVEWITTTERILEKTFVEQSLGTLFANKDFEILDVGAAESILSYELASFGYSVTAIDIRPISLFHPNLKFVQCDICEPVFEDNTFECIVALSTIEHIGLGWYGDEKGDSLDKKAVNTIFKLLKNEGYFILTVPYGKRAETPVHRIYDKFLLNDLLSDFSIVKIQYGLRQNRYTWIVTDEEVRVAGKEHDPISLLPSAAALVICKKK